MSRYTAKLLAPAALLLGLGLVACEPSADDCSALQVPSEPPRTIAVLVGVTGADRGAQIDADRRAAFEKVLDAGFCMKANLLFDLVGAGRGTEYFQEFRLEAEGQNDATRDRDEGDKRDALWAKIGPALDREVAGAPDVLSALAALHNHLDPSSARHGLDVILMSSMLNATAVLPVADKPALERPTEELIADFASKATLPACTGWRAFVVGPGRSASGSIDGQADANLHRLWASLLARCGGEVWRWEPQLREFPVEAPIGPPPTVARPTTTTPTTTPLAATVELPDAVLFETGKSTLRPDAGPGLSQIQTFVEANLAKTPSAVVEVAGHTDDVGTAEENDLLSQRRAEAVQGWLVEHAPVGLRVRAVGRGEREPLCRDETVDCRQMNRRVIVTIKPA